MKQQKPRRKAGHAGIRQNPTLIANPAPRSPKRKHKHNPKKVAPRGIQSGLMFFKKNPIDDLKVAGIPVFPVAIGAAGALALSAVLAQVPQVKAMKQDIYRSLVPAAASLVAGFAIFKFVQNPLLRSIGGYLASTGIVLAVNELAGKHIVDAVGSAFKPAAVAAVKPAATVAKPVATPSLIPPVTPTTSGFAGGAFGASDVPHFAGGAFSDADIPHLAGEVSLADLPFAANEAMSGFVALPPSIMGAIDSYDDTFSSDWTV